MRALDKIRARRNQYDPAAHEDFIVEDGKLADICAKAPDGTHEDCIKKKKKKPVSDPQP